MAIDAESGMVYVVGFSNDSLPSGNPVQGPHLRAYDVKTGELSWSRFEFDGSKKSSNIADGRLYNVEIGQDGELYVLRESAGTQTIFRYDGTKLSGDDILTKIDHHNDLWNSGSAHVAYHARVNKKTGEVEDAQLTMPRLPSSGESNTFKVGDIAADAGGRVYIGGETAASLANRNGISINGQDVPDYDGSDPSIMALSADFNSRMAWHSLDQGGASGAVQEVATRGDKTVLLSGYKGGELFTTEGPANAGGTAAHLTVIDGSEAFELPESGTPETGGSQAAPKDGGTSDGTSGDKHGGDNGTDSGASSGTKDGTSSGSKDGGTSDGTSGDKRGGDNGTDSGASSGTKDGTSSGSKDGGTSDGTSGGKRGGDNGTDSGASSGTKDGTSSGSKDGGTSDGTSGDNTSGDSAGNAGNAGFDPETAKDVVMGDSTQSVTVRDTAEVHGSGAAETVEMAPGAKLDFAGASGDAVAFDAPLSAHSFSQHGNVLMVQGPNGGTAQVALNGIVVLSFTDGSASAGLAVSDSITAEVGGEPVGPDFAPSEVELTEDGVTTVGTNTSGDTLDAA